MKEKSSSVMHGALITCTVLLLVYVFAPPLIYLPFEILRQKHVLRDETMIGMAIIFAPLDFVYRRSAPYKKLLDWEFELMARQLHGPTPP